MLNAGDFPNSSVWLWDVDNDKENGKKNTKVSFIVLYCIVFIVCIEQNYMHAQNYIQLYMHWSIHVRCGYGGRCKRISWTEKKTNYENVCIGIGIEEDKALEQTAIRRKQGFFGHVMRSDWLEKGMMLACGERRRRRGQPRSWQHKVTRYNAQSKTYFLVLKDVTDIVVGSHK